MRLHIIGHLGEIYEELFTRTKDPQWKKLRTQALKDSSIESRKKDPDFACTTYFRLLKYSINDIVSFQGTRQDKMNLLRFTKKWLDQTKDLFLSHRSDLDNKCLIHFEGRLEWEYYKTTRNPKQLYDAYKLELDCAKEIELEDPILAGIAQDNASKIIDDIIRIPKQKEKTKVEWLKLKYKHITDAAFIVQEIEEQTVASRYEIAGRLAFAISNIEQKNIDEWRNVSISNHTHAAKLAKKHNAGFAGHQFKIAMDANFSMYKRFGNLDYRDDALDCYDQIQELEIHNAGFMAKVEKNV